ncbi:HAD-IIB family hydrolase [uncultured Ferrovibrio sp.]|jgi:HAD superfamily hydrolase (TIGR01484 family)|uniref:HAD-IIB family hydrolase n=1 Tax=uncultured Ferrovibrio sp. TaxID=1576913 RepID=UPI00261A00F3|nr:HAD-IIB family hydrolase [uncultured Ferrovibrio sp.]
MAEIRPLSAFSAAERRGIRYVLTDIDDTLTTHGRLTAAAYTALERLEAAGLKVIPITGRPAGWCDMIARFWPVSGIVGENGALYMRYDRAAKVMQRRFFQSLEERQAARSKLNALAEKILREVPGTALASDQQYRECDLAIDFCEDVPPLSREDVDRIVALFEQAGATAKVSSIHVNGWFGHWDKLAMTRIFFEENYGVDLDQVRDQIVFAGDSPNDAPMFGYFPHSVGVANVRPFLDRIATPPAYVADDEGGAGFVQLADALIEARSQ